VQVAVVVEVPDQPPSVDPDFERVAIFGRSLGVTWPNGIEQRLHLSNGGRWRGRNGGSEGVEQDQAVVAGARQRSSWGSRCARLA